MGMAKIDQRPRAHTLFEVLEQIRADYRRGVLARVDWDHGPDGRVKRSDKMIWAYGGQAMGYRSGDRRVPTYDECWLAMVALAFALAPDQLTDMDGFPWIARESYERAVLIELGGRDALAVAH